MSAFDQVWKSVTGVPDSDFTAKRYTFAKFTATGVMTVDTPSAGNTVAGVIYEDNKAGQPTQIVRQGFAFITLGATLSAGADVMTDAAGKAVAYDPATAANQKAGTLIVGGAAGDIGTVLLA